MMIVVAYDISDNRSREQVARRLIAMGFSRIQRSVFVGRGTAAVARDVARMVRRFVDESTDTVHILVVSDREWSSRIVVGVGERAANSPVYTF